MTDQKEITVRGYCFKIGELAGTNPYNDDSGNPLSDKIEASFAWCEAAHIYRLSVNSPETPDLGKNNFGVCSN